METAVSRGGNKAPDVSVSSPEDDLSGGRDAPSVTGLDNYKNIGGFNPPSIPLSGYEYGTAGGGGHEIPNNPPNLLNDYGRSDKQEYAQETEKSYGSSTSMRRQEAYDHQEYSHEKTRNLPGWRSGWSGGEAADDTNWKVNYDTSANEINEVNRSGHFTGNLLILLLLEIFLAYVYH